MISDTDWAEYQSLRQKSGTLGGYAGRPQSSWDEQQFQVQLATLRRQAQSSAADVAAADQANQQAAALAKGTSTTPPSPAPTPSTSNAAPATSAVGGTAIGGGGGSVGGGAMSGLAQAGGGKEFAGAQQSLAQYLPQLVGSQSAGRQGIGQRQNPALTGLLQVRAY